MNVASEQASAGARVYPPPPWSYVGTRVLYVVCRVPNAAAVHRWVPAALQPAREDGLFVLWFANAPSIPEAGAHYRSKEGGIIIPARTADGSVSGSTFATMIVDNDVALAGGREIWGYPKQLGGVRFETRFGTGEAGTVSAAAHLAPWRDGEGACAFSVEATLDGSGEAALPVLATLEPRLLRRAIPDPYGPGLQSDDMVQVAVHSVALHEQRTGTATVRLGPAIAGLADWGAVEVLGAVFRVCDFVLPHGRPLPAAEG